LANSIGQKVSGGVEFDATNEDLAASANVTTYTTSRLMSAWQKSGAIRRSRGKILLTHDTFLSASEAKFWPNQSARTTK
jgi:CRP-like cAMP-binding protein